MTDEPFEQKIKAWIIMPPPEEFFDSLSREIVYLPQSRPFTLRIERFCQKFFEDWSSHMTLKIASLVVIAFLGFGVGWVFPPLDEDFQSLSAFGFEIDEEVL